MAKRGTTRKAKKEKVIKTKPKIYVKEIKGIDLRQYISKPFQKALDKEFEISCAVPISLAICTCGPHEKNQKMFFLSYPKSDDYKNKKLIISCESKITNKDLMQLKNVFKNGKYKR